MVQKTHKPPRPAQWIISRISLYNDKHSIYGDIEELYQEIISEKGSLKADFWYWMQTIFSVFTFIRFSILWSTVMIRNHLKITFRNLLKYKGFSFINITGLAMSMAACLMIIIFIKDQKSSDRFHEKKDLIVRIYTTDKLKNMEYSEIKGWATTPGLLAPYIRDNYPFIKNAVRIKQMWENVIISGSAISSRGMYVEPSFLEIFTYKLKEGDPETALNKPYSIILTEKAAQKFFGSKNPVNETLYVDKVGDFTVTGVLKDNNLKSHFEFEVLASFSTVQSLKKSVYINTDQNSWESYKAYYTYLLLKDKKNKADLENQLTEIAKTLIPEPEIKNFGFRLQELADINLGINLSNAMPGTKQYFDIIFIPILAVLIIFLACFNYIILSVARSLKRTKEIGLRKVVGAKRSQIIKLFLSETFTVTFLALITACLIILWLIPVFNGIDTIENSRMQINIELMKDPAVYLIFILFALVVSIIAGLYPALYLSSIKPVNALHGHSRVKGFSHLLTRKILMAAQFAVSLASIIFIVYFFQLHTFWMTLDRGISVENTVHVRLGDVNYETFRNEIITGSNVTGVSFSNNIPVHGGWGFFKLKTVKMEKPRNASSYCVDTEYINNFDLDLVHGRNFSSEYSTDKENAFIINETAVRAFELVSPEESIGKTLTDEKGVTYTVIGVVKDFIYSFPDIPVRPLVFQYRPEKFRYANISFIDGKKEEIKTDITKVWKKFDKVHPVRYTFFDDKQEEVNSSISGTIKISAWSCGFVILIALFGLFGMSAYTTEMRVKEIGIRKVLGANVPGVTYMLSKNYIKLILYSAAVAVPGTYFLTEAIFQSFAFRPELNLWVLPGALVFILILAFITLSSQTVKAALANPVDTLKEE